MARAAPNWPETSEAHDEAVPPSDRSVVVHGVSWGSYCLMRELLDSPGIRLTYLEGALEIMSPSQRHEFLKTLIGRLVEVFADERDVPLQGYGSTTFRREAKERGLEPDECYCLGRQLPEGDPPDVAIEVVLSSGGLNKLSIYAGLGVREVWFWRRGRFEIHILEGETYRLSDGSAMIPGLRFEPLAQLIRDSNDQHEAVKAYRKLLKAETGDS